MHEFLPFRLDTVNQCLWRQRETAADECIALTPKAFAVLRYLVEHAGRLVPQEELLEAVWPETFIKPEVLKSRIFEIRVAGDRRILVPHLLDYSFIQRWSSAYREAHRNTVENLAILVEGDTESLYLDTTYWQSHAVIPWGLWFLGEWGEALHEIKVAVTLLEKNGDDRAAQMLRLFQAWVHLHAMDFAGVRAISVRRCSPGRESLRRPPRCESVRC